MHSIAWLDNFFPKMSEKRNFQTSVADTAMKALDPKLVRLYGPNKTYTLVFW